MAIKRSTVWPLPVYVATFADGTECRLSIGSYKKGVTYNFERGRRACCQAIGTERVYKAHKTEVDLGRHARWGAWHPDQFRNVQPASDLVTGHFDHDGVIVPDPYFSTAPETPKAKPSSLDRLIASVNKLSAADLARLSVEIDAKLNA